MITDNDDTQRYMDKAQPIGPTYSAQIVHKSRVMATLCGRDADELKDRAYRYADCMNWRRAAVTVVREGRA